MLIGFGSGVVPPHLTLYFLGLILGPLLVPSCTSTGLGCLGGSSLFSWLEQRSLAGNAMGFHPHSDVIRGTVFQSLSVLDVGFCSTSGLVRVL